MTPAPCRSAESPGRVEAVRNQVLVGDAATTLASLPEASADCVVTSPPYFQVRDYGMPGQLGMEPDIDGWVADLRAVAAEAARVLKPHGAFWLNVADSFSAHPRYGAPTKSLLLGPERLLLALAAEGWLVRNRVVWAKTNPMPTSTRDRLNLTWEILVLLVRRRTYYFDLDAIREPHRSTQRPRARTSPPARQPERQGWVGPLASSRNRLLEPGGGGVAGHRLGKNPGDVWPIATRGAGSGHHAVFPPDLVLRPILATCPARVCGGCGLPAAPTTRGHEPTATGPRCGAPVDVRPGIVLDPFLGSGTVGLVAQEHGRDWLGIELNPAYADLARRRIAASETALQEAA